MGEKKKPGTKVHTWNPSTQKVKIGRSGIESIPWLFRQLKDCLGNLVSKRAVLTTKKQKGIYQFKNKTLKTNILDIPSFLIYWTERCKYKYLTITNQYCLKMMSTKNNLLTMFSCQSHEQKSVTVKTMNEELRVTARQTQKQDLRTSVEIWSRSNYESEVWLTLIVSHKR